jgi:hypothetical protein
MSDLAEMFKDLEGCCLHEPTLAGLLQHLDEFELIQVLTGGAS